MGGYSRPVAASTATLGTIRVGLLVAVHIAATLGRREPPPANRLAQLVRKRHSRRVHGLSKQPAGRLPGFGRWRPVDGPPFSQVQPPLGLATIPFAFPMIASPARTPRERRGRAGVPAAANNGSYNAFRNTASPAPPGRLCSPA